MKIMLVMLAAATLWLIAPGGSECVGQGKGKPKAPAIRHGVLPDIDNYPQATPKEALASALRAIDKERIDYLMALLVDPDYVDNAVASAQGGFDTVVKETRDQLASNPDKVKDLRRFLKEGDFSEEGNRATVKHREIKNRMVYLLRIDQRWYVENREDPS